MLIASPNFEQIFFTYYNYSIKSYTDIHNTFKLKEFWILDHFNDSSLRFVKNGTAQLFNDEDGKYQTYSGFCSGGEFLTEEQFIEEANKLIKSPKFDEDMKDLLS